MNQENLLNYLTSHSIFTELGPEHLKILAQYAEEKEIAKGGLLFKQDDKAEHFYVIREGSITVEVPSVYGPPLEVQTIGPDGVLGWSWLIAPYTWAFEATANSESQVLVFDGKSVLAQCEEQPEFGFALMKQFAGLMSERLAQARIKMMESWAPAGWA